MSEHPLNLLLRFVLELAGLAAFGIWAQTMHDGLAAWAWTIGLVVGAATVWGVFRVPNDGGPPVVAVSGRVRLSIEAAFFAGATAALLGAGLTTIGVVFAAVAIAQYAISHDRVARLAGCTVATGAGARRGG